MNIEQVREYTLSLFGVTEDQPFGDDNITFRLEGKIFMCLSLGGDEHEIRDSVPRLALKLSPERNEDEQLDDTQIEEWIKESYRLVASKLPKAIRQKYI